MQRRFVGVIGALVLLFVGSGCTQGQVLRYIDAVMQGHKIEADVAVHEYEAVKAEAVAGLHCEEWYDLAIEAGFTPENWREPVARIMWRESMCNPHADNPSSTANGLMQIVVGTWRSSCPDIPYTPYDPAANLACAFRVSGGGNHWGPWVTY